VDDGERKLTHSDQNFDLESLTLEPKTDVTINLTLIAYSYILFSTLTSILSSIRV